MPDICPKCNCEDIASESRGRFCTQCGYVFHEGEIVNEQTFTEGPRGVSADGQWVSASGAVRGSTMSRPSREITMERAKRKIQHLAGSLNLTTFHIDAAVRVFSLALQFNFVKGRRSEHVNAACLYTVCRREKTSHMLMDFADALNTNVYILGHTFLSLCVTLHLQLPVIDPSLYIDRFAQRLKFGNKVGDVSTTALRLIQKMGRNWIVTGRRPSGICGAALLIAARVHGFERSVAEIVPIVRITQVTIKKRLSEFNSTTTSQLTPEEFEVLELEHEMNPPCFTHGRARTGKRKAAAAAAAAASAKRLRLEQEENSQDNQEGEETAEGASSEGANGSASTDLSAEMLEMQELVTHSDLVAVDQEMNSTENNGLQVTASEEEDVEGDIEASAEVAEEHAGNALFNGIVGNPFFGLGDESELSNNVTPTVSTIARNAQALSSGLETFTENDEENVREEGDGEGEEEGEVDGDGEEGEEGEESQEVAQEEGEENWDEEEEEEAERVIPAHTDVPSSYATGYMGPSDPQEQINDPFWRENCKFYWEVKDDDGNLDEFKDEDIAKYLCTPEEAMQKLAIWEELNREYLIEMEEKRKFSAERGTEPPKPRQKRGPRQPYTPAATAGKAAATVLQKKVTSSKINYKALENLLSGV